MRNRTEADAVLKDLLGEVGPDVHIKPPLHGDYGIYIVVEARAVANYGLVALDVARITIGRDMQICDRGQCVDRRWPNHFARRDHR